MITFENTDVQGFPAAIRGMRNPLNSWDKSDSYFNDAYTVEDWYVGENDLNLMKRLYSGGTTHRKYARMVTVTVDITAPMYWWKEFDTYKIGTVANSCSTMHKLFHKDFELSDFSHTECSELFLEPIIKTLNELKHWYEENDKHDKRYWQTCIDILPMSYNQKRTVMMNYETIFNIRDTRKGHKLIEWSDFLTWTDKLPYMIQITDTNIKENSNDVQISWIDAGHAN